MIKFTFNKKARLSATGAIKKLETGSLVSGILGAFGANPRLAAVVALVTFVLCRIGEIVITGIEDHDE
ncbi:MAG: hypothetical protein V4462_02920 [Pseudomonadota bacterium]